MQARKKVAYFQSPTEITFFNKPPKAGGKPKTIPMKDVLSQFKMSDWIEGVSFNLEDESSIRQPKNTLSPSKAATCFASIQANSKNFAICYMNEQVGYGVFALNYIPKESWVAVYGGDVIPVDTKHPLESHKNHYALVVGGDLKTATASINAERDGNLARFFQHLPYEANTFLRNDTQLSNVALANIEPVEFIYAGLPIVLMKTFRDMYPGDQAGWFYNHIFWLGFRAAPSLFDRHSGEIINPNSYVVKNIDLRVAYKYKGASHHLDFEVNLTELLEDFNKGPACFRVIDENLDLVVTKEEFLEVMKKYAGSPFVVIENPTVVETAPEPIAKVTTQLGNLGLLSPASANPADVVVQLKRIFESLGSLEWKYNAKKNIAHVTGEEKDREKFKIIAEYLLTHGVQAKAASDPTGKPLIHVIGPVVERLKGLQVYQEAGKSLQVR